MSLYLDIVTTVLGLAYIVLEYRASLWMWAVGFVMQALGIVLYYDKGLYADCGMEFYYLSMTVYGFLMWRRGGEKSSDGQQVGKGTASARPITQTPKQPITQTPKQPITQTPKQPTLRPITHMPRRLMALWIGIGMLLWALIWYLLTAYTDSRVPIADSFTTAFSLVGIWALARKYLEQWVVWIVVDVVTSALYFYKDIPFKASLYALYVVIAVFGYRRWLRIMKQESNT